jgi:hypothetical protein
LSNRLAFRAGRIDAYLAAMLFNSDGKDGQLFGFDDTAKRHDANSHKGESVMSSFKRPCALQGADDKALYTSYIRTP